MTCYVLGKKGVEVFRSIVCANKKLAGIQRTTNTFLLYFSLFITAFFFFKGFGECFIDECTLGLEQLHTIQVCDTSG